MTGMMTGTLTTAAAALLVLALISVGAPVPEIDASSGLLAMAAVLAAPVAGLGHQTPPRLHAAA